MANPKVAVIGAGVTGLRVVHHLRKRRVAVDGFERMSACGGMWYAQEAVETCRLQSHSRFFHPEIMRGFAGRDKPHASELADAIASYAQSHDLLSSFTFGVSVRGVRREEEGLYLLIDAREEGPFDFVVHTSQTTVPRIPATPFRGAQIHTSDLTRQRIDDVVGRGGVVAVVGGKKSAYDAVCAFARRSYKVFWIARKIYPVGEYGGKMLVTINPLKLIGAMIRAQLLGRSWEQAALDKMLSLTAADDGMLRPTDSTELNLSSRSDISLARQHASVRCAEDMQVLKDAIRVGNEDIHVDTIIWATGYAQESFQNALEDERYLSSAAVTDQQQKHFFGKGIGTGGFATGEVFAQVVEWVVCDRRSLSESIAKARRERNAYVATIALGIRAPLCRARLVLALVMCAVLFLTTALIRIAVKAIVRARKPSVYM